MDTTLQRKLRRADRRNRRLEAFNRTTKIPELLSLIFIHCIPENGVQPNSRRAPLNIAHVCQHWRTVAHSTPRVWSRVRLKHKNLTDDVVDRYTALLKHWLSLSANLPISLDLRISGRPTPRSYRDLSETDIVDGMNNDYDAIKRMLEFVVRYSPRWRNVTICTYPDLLQPLYRIFGRESPNLESYHLLPFPGIIHQRYGAIYSQHEHIDLSHNTKLQEATLIWHHSDVSLIHISPSLLTLEVKTRELRLITDASHDYALRRLCCGGFVLPLQTLFTASTIFLHLEHLEILLRSPIEGLGSLKGTLTFHRLRLLKVMIVKPLYINRVSEDPAKAFFDHLLAPELRSLIVDWSTPFSPRELQQRPHAKHLVQRSGKCLRSLSLINTHIPEDGIVSLLECLPSLTNLNISGRISNKQIFNTLTLPRHYAVDNGGIGDQSATTGLCPHLESLSLLFGLPPSSETILNLLASRISDLSGSNQTELRSSNPSVFQIEEL
ncbi:hypothetical protein B7463_g7077, partial [Scytalidium lignicola]